MSNLVKINDMEIPIKEYRGQRVVTLKEIDALHKRAPGTARKRFGDNRQRFIEGVDYFFLRHGDRLMSVFRTLEIPNRGLTLVTETGYLMLVKSFTDDLAWKVQRDLVNYYFSGSPEKLRSANPKETVENLLQKLRERSTTTKVLVDLFDTLGSDEYRRPISEVLRIISFDISCVACDLVKAAPHTGSVD